MSRKPLPKGRYTMQTPAGEVTIDWDPDSDYAKALRRVRDAMRAGRNPDPEDAEIVRRWAES